MIDHITPRGYRFPAPYKTGAGRCNPKLRKATPDAASVFFCVRHMRHSMAWCAIHPRGLRCRPAGLLTHHAAHNGAVCSDRCTGLAPAPFTLMSTPRRQIMVTLAGQPQGWPDSFLSGIATPVNVTAPIERCNSGGDSLTRERRPFIMAKSAQKPVVYLPYVAAVTPDNCQLTRWIRETENQLLDRVKAALDEAGVAWIDPRTKERSQPAATDSEGCDNAQ